jgi:serine/threonine-protein kinase
LQHPQVVKLFDFFVEDHRGYLVLERITGRSLSQLVAREGPRPEVDVVELARQMCNILEYLHGLTPPLVHRDFTPDNLIFDDDEILKLIDFNVACAQNYTTTATVVGKRAYLPPEQFRGKPCTQSDIYAFGGTLYYLLTGEEPEPITTSHPILSRRDVSEELDHLVARATNPDLKLRYFDVTAIRHDLNACADRDRTAI